MSACRDELEYYSNRLREVQSDYEYALSWPRAILRQFMWFRVPSYILHADGRVEMAAFDGPEDAAVLDSVRSATAHIHDQFREPMRKAAEDYQRAREHCAGTGTEPSQSEDCKT